MSSWAQKEFMDCASARFMGRLFQSLMVFGKNEHRCSLFQTDFIQEFVHMPAGSAKNTKKTP